MQADATRGTRTTPGTLRGPVTDALRAMEAILLRSGQQTARRNAWRAVCEDRKRARDRRDALTVLETAAPTAVRPGSL